MKDDDKRRNIKRTPTGLRIEMLVSSAQAILQSKRCPTCGKSRGYICRDETGNLLPTMVHNSRRALVKISKPHQYQTITVK